MDGCDGVCIGDAYISSIDFEKLNSLSDIYEIPIKVYNNLSQEELDILNNLHTFRIDESSYLKRSSKSRGVKIIPNNTNSIKPYMVTIDNELYKRYTGEVSIALKEMENKGFVNVVGVVCDDAHTLIDLVKPGSKFKFKICGFIGE